MEGKAVLFKRFADIEVFDLEVDSKDPNEVIKFCQLLELSTAACVSAEMLRSLSADYAQMLGYPTRAENLPT